MKKLVKASGNEKKINGVCGGIGNYFNIDPVLVRVAFATAFLCFGIGLGTYILFALFMPKESQVHAVNA